METAGTPKCRALVDQVGDELVFRRRIGSSGVVAFFVLWMTIWTVGCVVLVVRLWQEPTFGLALFSIPFLVGWTAGFAMLSGALLGFERLQVGRDGLEYRTLMSRRAVPLGEVKGIAHYERVVDSETGRTLHGLRIETLGRPIRIGLGLDEGERIGLVERLLARLRALAPAQSIEDHAGGVAKLAAHVEVLGPERTIPGPPSDCSLRLLDGWDRTEIVRRGTVSPPALATFTGVVLFWNGIVGVFVMQLLKNFEWDLFLFLIPFEAIGLLMFVVWLSSLLASFTTERWAIGPREIATHRCCLGLRRGRRFDPEELGRVELRKDAPEPGKEDDTPYSLGLVGVDGRDLIVVAGLTEGEARWAGGVARDLLKGSMPKGGGRAPSHQAGQASLWDREIDA